MMEVVVMVGIRGGGWRCWWRVVVVDVCRVDGSRVVVVAGGWLSMVRGGWRWWWKVKDGKGRYN